MILLMVSEWILTLWNLDYFRKGDEGRGFKVWKFTVKLGTRVYCFKKNIYFEVHCENSLRFGSQTHVSIELFVAKRLKTEPPQRMILLHRGYIITRTDYVIAWLSSRPSPSHGEFTMWQFCFVWHIRNDSIQNLYIHTF